MNFQKQPFRGVPLKRCSENMQPIYRRTPIPKCDFNKVALHWRCFGLLLTHTTHINTHTETETLRKIQARLCILHAKISAYNRPRNLNVLKVASSTKRRLLKMCHLRHRLRIFLFCRKIMLPSQDIQVSVFLTIPLFTESVTSRWVLVHETRYIFEFIFWTTTHEITKLGQLIDISKGNNFH